MKRQISKSILTAALIALPIFTSVTLSACSPQHKEESTGQYLDSSVITAKVKSKLLADQYVSGLPITVKTYKNVVQLSGFVNTRNQKARAMMIARQVEGVVDVRDALLIKRK